MKINEPVTGNERHLKAGSILVSRTDLTGIIRYCNRDFIEISGFSEQELIGSKHNLVRHPDMPTQLFEALWKTVQDGQPWTGVIKNRCKNGDFYWVKANITPLYQNGRVTGYLSVRTRPGKGEVTASEARYRRFNEYERPSWRRRLDGWRAAMKSLRVSTLLAATVFLSLAALSATGAMVVMRAPPATIIAFLGVTGVCTLALGLALTRYVTGPLIYARGKLRQIAEGNYCDWVETDRRDEIGSLLQAIKSTQIRLGFEVMDAREQAANAMRIKTALDNVSSPVMMVDPEFNIIYLNDAVVQLFKAAEPDLRKQLPEFDADRMLGSGIDQFHHNPEHQRRMMAVLSGTFQSEVEIAGRTLRLITNPVVDPDGRRLGTAIEWSDRTAEVAVEREIECIVAAARAGDLSNRIEMSGKTGFFEQLGCGINDLIGLVEQVFNDIAEAMSRIARGDLTQPIRGDYQGRFDTVKRDVNTSMARLEQIVAELRESADVITAASEEISTGNNSLSGRSEQQAIALEETAASMDRLTGTVRNNADNAQQANHLAISARESAEQGGGVVNRAVQAMDAIKDSSKKIAEIIGVIDEIAFQTNLLALNASVEAARAGEQGRGFAVVATEVRNLAGRSAKAAKEIKQLIHDSVDRVNTGSVLVNESGDTLTEIVNRVTQLGDIICEIAVASQQQSVGIAQVNQAVSSMDEVTQQNAVLAEQTSVASASMSEKAHEMDRMMSFFNVTPGAPDRRQGPKWADAEKQPAAARRVPPLVATPLSMSSILDANKREQF